MNYLKTWLTDLLCYTTCSALNLLNSPVWTTEHHFQIQVLHFSCISLSKHIHYILFLFSFSPKGEVQPFLSSHSEGYAEMYFTFLPLSSEQSFILCGLTLTIMEQECPIHNISYNMILLQAPERPLLKYSYQVVRAEIIAKASLEFFSCLYQKYLISENCVSTHSEILFRELIRLYHESPALNLSFIFRNWAL